MASLCPKKESCTQGNKEEISWGHGYRARKKYDKDLRALPTKKLSLDQTCKIAKMLLKQKCPKRKKKKKRVKKKPPKKIGLLERSTMSRKKYFDMLSTPNRINRPCRPPPEEDYCRKKLPCEMGPCPPRIVLMSLPNRRLLFETWRKYACVLSPETILRIDDMLHTEQNVDPNQALVSFKMMDRKKKKKLSKKKLLKLRRQKMRLKAKKKWIRNEVKIIAQAIMDYVRDEPLFDLNYKQLLFSDGLMGRLHGAKQIPKLNRTTKCTFKRTLIEICDKMAVWIDALMQFVESQYIESEVAIAKPPVYKFEPALEEEEEGEEEEVEEEEGEEGEEESEVEGGELEIGIFAGEEGEEIAGGKITDLEESELYFEQGEGFVGLEGADADLEFGEEAVSEEAFQRLLKIYDNCTAVDLTSSIMDERYPNATYADILQALKSFVGQPLYANLPDDQDLQLENLLGYWANTCDAEAIDIQIKDLFPVLGSMLASKFRAAPGSIGYMSVGYEGEEGFGYMGDEGDEGEEGYMGEEGEGFEGGEGVEGREGRVGRAGRAGRKGKEGRGGIEGREGIEGEEGIEGREGIEGEEGIEGVEGREEGEEDRTELITEMMEEAYGTEAFDEVFGVSEASERTIHLLEEAEEIEEEVIEGEIIEELPKEEVAILYEKCQIEGDIKSHKPRRVLEHIPGTICCLSLKIWSIWLLEITHNAHTWTKWMIEVVGKVREFATIIRGEVLDEDGQPKLLYKADWRKFCRENKKSIVKWYEYSKHVRETNEEITNEFRGKRVTCCPKCLQDNVIKDVVTAHETFKALTEAMNNAAYWHCTLDEQISETGRLGETEEYEAEEEEVAEICEPSLIDIYDLLKTLPCKDSSSDSSTYLLEEIVTEDEAQREPSGSKLSTTKAKKKKDTEDKKKKKKK